MPRWEAPIMEELCKQLGYLQAFMDVINQTWPNGDHLLVNLASPGAFAAGLHVCVQAAVFMMASTPC
jgi:hypothetical protein